VYKRQFTFGTTKDLTYFVPQYYPGVKQIFDELYKRDNHTITLKQAATTASATPNQ
jgi:hypothetical protein